MPNVVEPSYRGDLTTKRSPELSTTRMKPSNSSDLPPTDIPHHHTLDETRALRYLGETKCSYAPHLLQDTAEVGAEWVDEKTMGYGYVVFILMTKVPGERMDYGMFWSKSEEKREQIRRAFKTALL